MSQANTSIPTFHIIYLFLLWDWILDDYENQYWLDVQEIASDEI
jgi:hypothetical protein